VNETTLQESIGLHPNHLYLAIAGAPPPIQVATTSEIACMPTTCTVNDFTLVGANETAVFCPTMQPYNLSSCAVNFVAPPKKF
jgi:hypothetical protein